MTQARSAYGFGIRAVRVEAVLWPVSGLAIDGCFLAVLGVGGYRVAAGQISVADLVTFVLFLFMIIVPLRQLFSAIITVRASVRALARIQEIIDSPSEDALDAPASARFSKDDRLGAELSFEHVSFAYQPNHPMLTDITLTVAAGSTTAFVGPSGAGKSTLIALVERFYEPDVCVIRIDGEPLDTTPRSSLRAQIGYVEQDAPILAGTTSRLPHLTPRTRTVRKPFITLS